MDGEARPGRGDGGVHAGTARIPDIRRHRILRQMVCPAGRAAVALAANQAGNRPRCHEPHKRGLLPLRGDGDVHEAASQRCDASCAHWRLDTRRRLGIRRDNPHLRLVSGRDRLIHPAKRPGGNERHRAAAPLNRMGLSRTIFREYDIRGVAGKDLTHEAATLVAGAFAAFLGEKGVKGALAVGRDNRPSGEMLHSALVAGLLASGIDVVDIGIVPTPLAYWSQHNLDVVGVIQITGSHNPPEYNGFKLGLATASVYGADIQHLYDLAVAGNFPRGKGTLREEQVIDRYVDDIAGRVGTLSRKLKVVLDCGNGAGALVAPRLFPRLGIQPRCLFCDSDGTFPNHHPDPTVPENVEALIAAVKKDRADIGIAFDGDADRIGVIDNTGEIIWGDYLLIIYARDALTRTSKGQSIVFDVKA